MQTRRQFVTGTVAAALAAASFSPVPFSSVASANDANKWAVDLFEKTTHDFGTVARGADTTYRLKLKNIYKEAVHISNVRVTCGCTAGQPSQDTLQSLEEAYLEIKMDTLKFTRRKDSNVIVTFDQPRFAEVTIPITVYIRTDVVLEPGSAQFGSLQVGEKAERTLKLAYAGREDWKITKIDTGTDTIEAEAVETGRGGGNVNYDIRIRVSDKAPIGVVRRYITLMTDDENSPQVPVLIEGEVKPEFEVSPSLVQLGTMKPGETRNVRVVLKSKKPFEVEAVTCEKAKDVFQVRLPKAAAPVQVIPLTVTAPTESGRLEEQLSITIAGRSERVTFRATATIE